MSGSKDADPGGCGGFVGGSAGDGGTHGPPAEVERGTTTHGEKARALADHHVKRSESKENGSVTKIERRAESALATGQGPGKTPPVVVQQRSSSLKGSSKGKEASAEGGGESSDTGVRWKEPRVKGKGEVLPEGLSKVVCDEKERGPSKEDVLGPRTLEFKAKKHRNGTHERESRVSKSSEDDKIENPPCGQLTISTAGVGLEEKSRTKTERTEAKLKKPLDASMANVEDPAVVKGMSSSSTAEMREDSAGTRSLSYLQGKGMPISRSEEAAPRVTHEETSTRRSPEVAQSKSVIATCQEDKKHSGAAGVQSQSSQEGTSGAESEEGSSAVGVGAKTQERRIGSRETAASAEQRPKTLNGEEQEHKVKNQVKFSNEKCPLSKNGRKPSASSSELARQKSGEVLGKVTEKKSILSPTSSIPKEGTANFAAPGTYASTPAEHKTIIQMLQEAREEALLVRGTRTDIGQYSRSEMVLVNGASAKSTSGHTGDKQVTSSPNIKALTPMTHIPVKPGAPTTAQTAEAKEISRSEAILPAVERAGSSKQGSSSPNLSAGGQGKHAGSAEGLPRSRNGHPELPRVASCRKGSTISYTAAADDEPDGTSRARSATWSQAEKTSAAQKEAESAAAAGSVESEWDKRWSSAGSGDVLGQRVGGGKEWRSEGGKTCGGAWRGRVWESEAGLLGRPRGLELGGPGSLSARKELLSPGSSSTASRASGAERSSEAGSSSYHSAASTAPGPGMPPQQHQQQRVSVVHQQQQKVVQGSEEYEEAAAAAGEGSDDKTKLIEGSGVWGRGGVENRGADLLREEEEEDEEEVVREGVRPEEQRSLVEIWDVEDKLSAANSQLPLTPAGDEGGDSLPEVAAIEPERGNWTGRFDFLLSLLGYSVGLGNVWRFPYLCYNNGGGAFLIPFTIMLVIAGLPLMFMELSFGQYANLGPAAIYAKFCPLFHGLGYGMVIVSTVVMLYYNLIIAWTIFYMFASFNKQLPWQNCEAEWSTLDCYSYETADDCAAHNGTYFQRTCYNETEAAASNITHLAQVAEKRPPAEEYFTNFVLGLSNGIEETGQVRPSMALCLLLAWVIVFLCLSKGVQSSGKVVYFTALFPYVVLIILFVRGVTLPGASTGILFYLTPDWKRLANAQVWGDAAVQIFFALSPAWGGLITLSSYNKFSNNCYKDSLIVAVSNILTSFFAGFVIFSVIGFLAHELKVEVKKVVDQGAGLAFIVYPEVVTRLPISPLWSLLFFVMLLTLGLDSQFALMETVTTAILDRFPNLREKKVWVVLVVAVFGYFGGLIFTTNSGMYWLQLMDKYAANWSVLLIAISECIIIAWVYGADRFLRDVQDMIGPQSRLWTFFWCCMWKFVTPATLLFILFFNWVEYAPASYGEYIYPLWADAAGWVIGVFPVFVIIVVGVAKLCTTPEGSLKDRLRKLLQPTPDWGPSTKRSSAPPTYDSIRNTIVLMNGLPVIQETRGESQEDNTL